MSRVYGYFHQRRRIERVVEPGDVAALRERVAVLEAAIVQHMADHDARMPTGVTFADRALWRTVVPDGLTEWERRYGGC